MSSKGAAEWSRLLFPSTILRAIACLLCVLWVLCCCARLCLGAALFCSAARSAVRFAGALLVLYSARLLACRCSCALVACCRRPRVDRAHRPKIAFFAHKKNQKNSQHVTKSLTSLAPKRAFSHKTLHPNSSLWCSQSSHCRQV
jgi:hypothetical protein